MVTYYTAIGKMNTKKENGARIPVIMVEASEFMMTIDELIVWGSLHWCFMDKESLEREYSRNKANNRLFNDVSFEHTLNRLVTRGLVVSGTDYLAADALYGLIGTLKIRLVKFSLSDKLRTICYLYFKKGLTLKECYSAYFGHEITPNEKSVLALSKYVGISVSEIINCVENNITIIRSEEDIMDKLYINSENTYESITIQSRFSELKLDIVKAVVNLYQKKKIIFEN